MSESGKERARGRPQPPPAGEPIYRETQRFVQWWIWLVLAVIVGFSWFAVLSNLLGGGFLRENKASDIAALVVWVLVGLGLPALMLSVKLVVEVRRDGVYYRFRPFHRGMHRIAIGEIEVCEPRTYRPIMEYGGWGIRIGTRGRAYNISGNRGVQLTLCGGAKILFGSQRPEEFAAAVISAREHGSGDEAGE